MAEDLKREGDPDPRGAELRNLKGPTGRPRADRLEVLLQEKGLMHAEKLGLIQSIKQTYALLAVVTGLILTTAVKERVDVAYLVIPYIVAAAESYVMTNSVMLLLVCNQLEAVDEVLGRGPAVVATGRSG